MGHGLRNLRSRSQALARTPGVNPWKLLGRLYWRWWVASGIFLALFALFDFGFGWDAYRSNMSAYFPAVIVLIITLSTPRLIRARTIEGRGSRQAFLIAWGPYLIALPLFVALFVGLESLLGWTPQKSVLVGAYLSTLVVALGLSPSIRRIMRHELETDGAEVPAR